MIEYVSGSNEEKIIVLMQMGLTQIQARVYLSLTQIKTGTINNIAQVSKVSRQDVYQTLKTLQIMGVIEKIVKTPTEYKPLLIKEAISLLLQRKNEELHELQRKTAHIFQAEKVGGNIINSEEEFDFLLSPPKQCFRKECKGCKFMKKVEDAEISVDSFFEADTFKELYLAGSKCWLKPLARGTNFRFIISNPEKEQIKLKKYLFKKTSSFEIRHIYEPPPALCTIIDRKELLLKTSTQFFSPTLITKNSILVKILQEYFDMYWNKATRNYIKFNAPV